jgi:predicted membrane-bound spermidine synthase
MVSKPLYYDVLYHRVPSLAATPEVAAVVLFASLLVPTCLMGMSLPLLARALTTTVAGIGRVVGSLYGWNTLGAATGALMSTWMLLPRFGLERSLWLAAAVNLTCAAGAALLVSYARSSAGPRHTDEEPSDAGPLSQATFPSGAWVLLYGVTGFIALGLEIAWFRLLGVMLKSTTFTFGTLLAVYLAGFGLGAATGAGRVRRSVHPGLTFLLLQVGVTLYAAATTVGLVALLDAGRPCWLARYLAEYEPLDISRALSFSDAGAASPFLDFAFLYVAIPVAFIAPPTFLMGFSFPYLQRASHADLRRLGRRVGTLLASNIGGSMAGALLTGWLFLPVLGTAGTLRLLVGAGALLMVPAARLGFGSMRVAGSLMLAGAAAAAALLFMPGGPTLWARLHGTSPRLTIAAEDGTGVSVLKAERADFSGTTGVYVNGLGQSWIPYGGIHTALGALPVLIHPSPADVLIIGLGSGDTAFAAAARPEVQRLTCVEIIGAQRRTLDQLARLQPYPGLVALLTDPRISLEVGDGRAYVLQAERQFDVIEADALRPTSAYAGNLYSREYFTLISRRLTPGGIAVTWAPTVRTRRTFLSVFPHVRAFGDIYVGSHAGVLVDSATIAARSAAVRPYFERAGIDIDAVLGPFLRGAQQYVGPEVPRETTDLNTDTFPRDEFAVPF